MYVTSPTHPWGIGQTPQKSIVPMPIEDESVKWQDPDPWFSDT